MKNILNQGAKKVSGANREAVTGGWRKMDTGVS